MSKSQLNEILKEEGTDNNSSSFEVPTNNDGLSSYSNAMQDMAAVGTKIGGDMSAELTPKGGISDVSITIPNPLGGANGGADAIRNNEQEVNSALKNNINVKIPNVKENIKSFSKKAIEEARLRKMRNEGKIMTKGELRESFGNYSDPELYKFNKEDLSDGYGVEQFIYDYRELESLYDNSPEDAELQNLYKDLLSDWEYFNTDERQGQNFKEYCNDVISDMLKEKYGQEINESKINIKKKNKGKFNATKKRTGKSTEELTHSKNPLTRKRAVFAQNAKKWKKK